MKSTWQKLVSLAKEICTVWFQFFDAVFASKGYPFKNIFEARKHNFIACKDADKPVHSRSLVHAFVLHSLQNVIFRLHYQQNFHSSYFM